MLRRRLGERGPSEGPPLPSRLSQTLLSRATRCGSGLSESTLDFSRRTRACTRRLGRLAGHVLPVLSSATGGRPAEATSVLVEPVGDQRSVSITLSPGFEPG